MCPFLNGHIFRTLCIISAPPFSTQILVQFKKWKILLVLRNLNLQIKNQDIMQFNTPRLRLALASVLASASLAFAAAPSDSVTFTVKWQLAAVAGNRDSFNSFVIHSPSTGFYRLLATADLNKFKNQKAMDLRVPKASDYAMGFVFSCNKAEAMGVLKVVGHDNVSLQNDTAITFSGLDAVKRIGFTYIMPDGTPLALMSKSGSTEDWSAANAHQAYFQRIVKLEGCPQFTFSVYTPVTNNSSSTGTDRSRTADMYVNPGLPARFVFLNSVMVNPVSKTDHQPATDAPAVFILLKGNGAMAADTVISNDPKKFITITPPVPKPSLYTTLDAATQWGRKLSFIDTYSGTWAGFQSVGAIHDKQGRLAYYLADNSLPTLFAFQKLETKQKRAGSTDAGSGISLPPYLITQNGPERFYMAENISQGFPTYSGDSIGVMRIYPANSFYSFTPQEQKPDFGNSAPMLTFSMSWRPAAGNYKRPYPTNYTNAEWMGNWGERRCVDLFANKIAVTAGTDTLATEWAKLYSSISTFERTEHQPVDIRMEFDNTNFTVDSLPGRSLAIFQYNDGNTDINAPSLQMLQYRRKDGTITNKFKSFDEAELFFHAGDLNYTSNALCYFFRYAPAVVKVETSIHGRDQWTELQAQQQPDMFMMPIWGMGYKVTLSQYPKQKHDHYYDLRITLTDAAGNFSQQTLTPSFFVAGDEMGVESTSFNDNAIAFNYSNSSLEISGAENPMVQVFDTAGRLILTTRGNSVDLSALTAGIYLVRATDHTRTAVTRILR